jgi:hypothetical protein
MRGIWLVLGYRLVGLVRLDLNIARIAGPAERLKSGTGLRRGERTGDGDLRTSGGKRRHHQQQRRSAQRFSKYSATCIRAHVLPVGRQLPNRKPAEAD